ncbi:cytochrome c oxidase subunit II [Geomonas limicola]|nr:cytochrome c oxidase subunit II [Geomonas limicola]
MTTTEAIDPVFMFILGSCLVLLIGITVAMVVFVVRYHRSRAPEPTSQVDGSLWLEVIWTAFPTLLVLAMFYYGWASYLTLRNVPPGALQVTAVGRMWSWNFLYQNGKNSPKLYVPVGKPVQVALESKDVLHGFYVPAFRVKRDVVPGMKNHVWFVASKPGSYDIFCSQYCGTSHAAMIATIEAVPPEQFEAWLKETKSTGAQHPALALLEKHGCLGCHSLDGSQKVGPTFQGIWGRKTEVKTAGKEHEIIADEAYLKRSIVEPNADVVEKYPPVMPAFAGVLTEEEIRLIIDYFKTGGQAGAAKLDGAKLAKDKGCLACHSLDGSKGVGPSFRAIFGTKVKVVRNGKPEMVTIDEPYLKESILKPAAAVVDGYQPIMPVEDDLSPDEVSALVQFIKELK